MPNFHIVTLFPQFFHSPLQVSLLGRAAGHGRMRFTFHDPREFSPSRHPYVDDAPYGGGAGMVMQVEPLAAAIRSIASPGKIIVMSPSGRPLTAQLARQLACEDDITLVCGRYEGIDARLGDLFPLEDVSVGDAVLNGGETAALALIESVSRFTPDFMGNAACVEEESFSAHLLEYPQYTRPEDVEGRKVPEILLSGHHAHIAEWRRRQSVLRTRDLRPAMLDDAWLTAADAASLEEYEAPKLGRNLSFALIHHPVRLEKWRVGSSSLTNLDIHDIARVSRSYGLGAFYVLTPLPDQLALLQSILDHWLQGGDTDRKRALALVRPVADLDELEAAAAHRHGVRPVFLSTSTQWPRKNAPAYAPSAVREMLGAGPVVICLGTAQGLAREMLEWCDGQVRPIRFLGDSHLSVRSAAAILADRILGDFY